MSPLMTRHLTAVLLLGVTAAAQSGGPTMALAQGFSVDPATPLPGYDAKSVILTETNFSDAVPPPAVPSPGMPDFSALPIPAALDVDALSIGADWVLSDPAGFVAIPPGNWGVLTWTVRRTTVGLPGSVIAGEVSAADGAAADVFAYVLPGSALPPPIVGIPFRAQDSTEISVFSGPPGNLDAHDLFIGLIYRDNPQLAAMLPPPTVFFSVTDATKTAIPPGWASPALRSGATVFATTWIPGTSSWSLPSVFLTPAAMGLFASEDLDGLALDLAHGRVLLSTDLTLPPPMPTPPRNPLLYSSLFSGLNTTYRLPGGVPVSTAIGLGGADDTDGICMLDPGNAVTPTQQRIDRMIGTPGNPVVPSAPTTLQTCVARHFNPVTTQESFRTFMTGFPPGGPAPGFALVGITIGSPAVGPWITSGFFLRPDPASPYFAFQGHPERHDFPIPSNFSLIGAPLSFVWGAFSGANFSLSLPATITL